MRSLNGRQLRLAAPLALGLVAGLGALSLRAGDVLSTEFAVTADATAPVNPPLNVREANVDGNGNIKVHEQGVVHVTGTVDVGNSPKVQDVNITNEDPLEVTLPDQGTSQFYFEEIRPFNEDVSRTVDIHKYAHVRFRGVVNGSGTVEFFVSTDAGVHFNFEVDAGHDHSVYLGEAAGTKMFIQCIDPDGEQIFLEVFGSN